MTEHNTVTFIEGNQVNLLPINFDHIDLYIKWENNPGIRRYSRNVIPNTKEEYKKYLKSLQKKNPDLIPFEIYHKKDHIPIGICELSDINWINQTSFLGIIIGEPTYWGKNYCVEVIELLVIYAFEELNLEKLKYGAFSPNIASIRCAEKVGFSHEATLIKEMYIDGQYYDSILCTLFKEDWVKSRK
jgi:RimJ/RimL family protein N-acetyltransferase